MPHCPLGILPDPIILFVWQNWCLFGLTVTLLLSSDLKRGLQSAVHIYFAAPATFSLLWQQQLCGAWGPCPPRLHGGLQLVAQKWACDSVLPIRALQSLATVIALERSCDLITANETQFWGFDLNSGGGTLSLLCGNWGRMETTMGAWTSLRVALTQRTVQGEGVREETSQ